MNGDFQSLNLFSREFRELLQDLADNAVRRDQLDFGPNMLHRNIPGNSLFLDALQRTPERQPPILYAKITAIGHVHASYITYKATQVYSNGEAPTNPIVWDGVSSPLLRLLPGGFGPAINKVVRVNAGRDQAGDTDWTFENHAPFLAIITGNATFVNRFFYAWSEAEISASNFIAVTGGRTGTTTTDYALNMAEANHSATYAWGVDRTGSSYSGTAFAPRPVGGAGADNTHRYNVPVWMYETAVVGSAVYWFQSFGSHDGDCS